MIGSPRAFERLGEPTFPVISIRAFVFDLIIPIATILHVTVAIAVIWASGTITVAAVVIAIAAVIAARRISFAAATRGYAASTGRTIAARGAVAAGVEAPGSRGRGASPL